MSTSPRHCLALENGWFSDASWNVDYKGEVKAGQSLDCLPDWELLFILFL